MKTDNNVRQSNFELLRILLMLFVIAHHYVVSSGLMGLFNYDQISAKMIYFQFYGAFGKVAINAFVLITGYFMCTATYTWKKLLKLYLQIKFYRVVLYAVFLLSGYHPFDYHEVLETLFSTFFLFGEDYAETYLALYLLVPFLNKLIDALTENEHLRLLLILLFLYTGISSFSVFLSIKHSLNDTWNYLGWMITVYLVGAYVRKYRIPHFLQNRYAALLFGINVLLIFASILVVDYVGVRVDFSAQYWFVNNANKLLAFTTALTLFCCFKDIQIRFVPLINKISSCTFGVYLIHTVNASMRQWLWTDLLQVPAAYQSDWAVMYSVVSVATIFAVCTLIDYLRICLMERIKFFIIPVNTLLHEER